MTPARLLTAQFRHGLGIVQRIELLGRGTINVALTRLLLLKASHAFEYRNAAVGGFRRTDMRCSPSKVAPPGRKRIGVGMPRWMWRCGPRTAPGHNVREDRPARHAFAPAVFPAQRIETRLV
jgi:hypothetical protein